MLDAGLIEKCADPSLTPAIVEQFVAAAGSDDPLAVTVKSGGRLILLPKPKTPEEALDIIKQHVGKANVRIGLTQFPAGIGITDSNQLDVGLVDACENLKRGTTMFAKIARIVTKWYGRPTNPEVVPQLFEDAVHAWKTGEFDGAKVFYADDPGGATFLRASAVSKDRYGDAGTAQGLTRNVEDNAPPAAAYGAAAPADIRIDLSRIGGAK